MLRISGGRPSPNAEEKLSPKAATTVLSKLRSSNGNDSGEAALGTLKRMLEGQLRGNAFHYNVIISSKSDWSLALNFFRQLPLQEVNPNIASYAATISAAGSGHWHCACSLLRETSRCLRLDAICWNSAIGTSPWASALTLFSSPDMKNNANSISFNSVVTALERGSQWEGASTILGRMMQSMHCVRLPNEITIGAWVTACGRSTKWQLAAEGCRQHDVRPSQATYNAAISSCEKATQWQFALLLLKLLHRILQRDLISQNAAISACEKASHWTGSLILFQEVDVVQDVISYSAVISAFRRAKCWDVAVELLNQMSDKLVLPNSVIYGAAGTACQNGKQWQWSIWLTHRESLGKRERSSELSETAWRSVKRLNIRRRRTSNPEAMQVQETLADVYKSIRPEELATLVWSFSSLSMTLQSSHLMHLAMQRITDIGLARFNLADIARLAWSFSSGEFQSFLEDLQKEFVSRQAAWHGLDFTTSALTVVWACSHAGCLRVDTASSIEGALLKLGRSFGGDHVEPLQPSHPSSRITRQPGIVRNYPDFLVIQKPSEWQVDDAYSGQPEEAERGLLSFFLKAMFPRHGVLKDVDHSRGFLHRLDVPSSGLILVAKTHQGWYRLKMQAAAGEIVRDYTALSHGWLNRERQVTARVHWWPDGRRAPSAVSQAGRVARTKLTVAELYRRSSRRLCLLAIRIGTGRMHQIRLHTAHIGHPTVCDAKYCSATTFKEDKSWCPRHFLHRHRLILQEHEVTDPLAPDLEAVLGALESCKR